PQVKPASKGQPSPRTISTQATVPAGTITTARSATTRTATPVSSTCSAYRKLPKLGPPALKPPCETSFHERVKIIAEALNDGYVPASAKMTNTETNQVDKAG